MAMLQELPIAEIGSTDGSRSMSGVVSDKALGPLMYVNLNGWRRRKKML
jgi:hypothetical protein